MTSSFRTPAKKSVLIRLFWGFFLLFLLLHPKQTSQAVVLGLTICATRLIPSLFPLMVLSVFASHSGVCTAFGQFLCRLTKDRMNLGNAGWGAFLLGTVAGFPLGALTVFELQKRGELSEQQARRLCGICNNTGPAFLIAYVGEGLLGDARIGWMLFACQTSCRFYYPVVYPSASEAKKGQFFSYIHRLPRPKFCSRHRYQYQCLPFRCSQNCGIQSCRRVRFCRFFLRFPFVSVHTVSTPVYNDPQTVCIVLWLF